MPKPAKVIRPVQKNLSLPGDTVARVEVELFSPLQSRVPHGAWAELVNQLLLEWLEKREGGGNGAE